MASFFIFLRESLEAAMICSIMFAYLSMMGRRDRYKDVWIGIMVGILVSLLGGIAVYSSIEHYDGSDLHFIIEGISYFLACGLLTYMTSWIKNKKNLNEQVNSRIQSALDTRSIFAISSFVFLTVCREGLEAVVFMIPITLVSNSVLNVVGAFLGIFVGLFLGYVIYVLGKKVKLKRLFNTMTIFLVLFAAGMLAEGIKAFQELGWLPFGNQTVWNTSSIFSQDSAVGGVLHSLLGYSDSPTSLQLTVYVGYLVTVIWVNLKRNASK